MQLNLPTDVTFILQVIHYCERHGNRKGYIQTHCFKIHIGDVHLERLKTGLGEDFDTMG